LAVEAASEAEGVSVEVEVLAEAAAEFWAAEANPAAAFSSPEEVERLPEAAKIY
jgi:hypothetical protein